MAQVRKNRKLTTSKFSSFRRELIGLFYIVIALLFLLSIYGYITGIKKDMKHMHEGIHDLGGKIDKIYWVVLGTVGAVSLLLLEKVIDKGLF